MESSKTKYALYKYSSHNIGDEIQSVAARQFLPKVDYYIDRDQVGAWRNNIHSEKVKLIANGWYMSSPMQWPIADETLDPLLTSIHLNESDSQVIDTFSSTSSVKFLKKHGPVGARDEGTKKIFETLGITTNLSACLTLTLEKDASIQKKDFILCVTVSDEVYEAIRSHTKRMVIRIDTTTFDENLSSEEKFKLAEQFLYLYQSAHFVITTRLHAALPSLALETPMLYITDSGAALYDPSRLDGLKELANNVSEAKFLADIEDMDFETPEKNPDTYMVYRRNLTKRCEEFTGHNKAKTFAVNNDFSNFNLETSELFRTIIYNYNQEADSSQRIIRHYMNQSRDLSVQLAQLNTIRISLRKLVGNVKRKIKG